MIGDNLDIWTGFILGRRDSSVWFGVNKMSQYPLRAGKGGSFGSFSAFEGDLDPVLSTICSVHHSSFI
jgi:hypothetical protein